MVRPICHDKAFLSKKSEPATKDDLPVIQDLMDTFIFHQPDCVGMAANMIGVAKSIIVVRDGPIAFTLLNPVLLSTQDPYEVSEACLCLRGDRKVWRYKTIVVSYQDEEFKRFQSTFHGLVAEIIQHEMNHLEGILI
jgi:peptide deformylase